MVEKTYLVKCKEGCNQTHNVVDIQLDLGTTGCSVPVIVGPNLRNMVTKAVLTNAEGVADLFITHDKYKDSRTDANLSIRCHKCGAFIGSFHLDKWEAYIEEVK